MKKKFGDVDFLLIQFLTGHQCFRQYLYRFKKLEDPKCVNCKETVDDAEHAFFRCDRWWILRRELEDSIGSVVEPETIVQCMLQSRERWEAIQKFVYVVLSRREDQERAKQ